MTSRSNKKIGTAFENTMVGILKAGGCWVHFLNPDARGAQPFDILAVKNGKCLAVECKTLREDANNFPMSRIEENQVYAMNRWISCGNASPHIAILHKDDVYLVPYMLVRDRKRVNMESLAGWIIGRIYEDEEGDKGFMPCDNRLFTFPDFIGSIDPK